MEDFKRDLQAAVNNALPSSTNPYGKVAVLAFHWQNDEDDVEPFEADLLEVFRDTYGYYTETFAIPSRHSVASIVTKLGEFSMKWAGQDALRIYVYSGHAEIVEWPSYELA
jgi:hypothetical protein